MCKNSDTITDCFGMEYKVVKMRGSGFCLYHSLSYCLTGNDRQYESIIDDCLTVFQNIPELFRLRTNFGSYCDSSLTDNDYVLYMQPAIGLVQADHCVDSHAYGDEGHIAAIALLYDIMVFTYSTQNKSWYVFNESSRKGYICLLNLPDHFDVLHGTDGPPAIPPSVHTVGVNRHNFSTTADAWKSLQHNRSFQYVFRFPQEYSGVHILNNPVVAYTETCTSSNEADIEWNKNLYVCDYGQCNFTGKSAQALSLHKRRPHSIKTASAKNNLTCLQKGTRDGYNVMKMRSDDALQVTTDNIDKHKQNMSHIVEYLCDFEQCGYIGKNKRALQMHKKTCHVMANSSKARKLDKKSRKVQSTITGEYDVEMATCTRTNSICVGTFAGSGIDNMVCDADTPVRIESKGVRRSEHIAKKRTASFTDSQPGCHLSRKVQCLFDINNDTLQHEIRKGLKVKSRRQKKSHSCAEMDVEPDSTSVSSAISTHSGLRRSVRISNRQTNFEGGKLQNDIAENSESTSRDEVNINNRSTRKLHMKKSFSRVISECEKKFIPTAVPQQSDPLYDKLKAYHDNLLRSVSNTTTEKISAEILDVVENVSLIDTSDRRYLWSVNDEQRLNELNRICKLLQPRTQWTWGAPDDTELGQYNDKRMQLCVTKECQWKIIECTSCDSTGILVGDQTDSEICYDCLKLYRVSEKERKKRVEAWNKVKPTSKDFPKAADGTNLPHLDPGSKAVISPVHPVVTIKKNHYADKRLRLECISLLQDPVPTWVKTLPRTSFVSRFMIIERRVKQSTKYIVANADHVRQWLRYLFLNHKDFIRMQQQNQLAIDEAAIDVLESNEELAEVDYGLVEHTESETRQI